MVLKLERLALGLLAVVLGAGLSCAYATGTHYGVTVSTGATLNVTFKDGVFTGTGERAVLNIGDLESALASSAVTITTGNGDKGKEKGDLHIETKLDWANTNALTLDAYRSIFIDQPVSDSGTGALHLAIDHGGKGGAINYGAGGNITIKNLSDVLTINGKTYKLVGDIGTLAQKISANPSGIYALANAYNAGKDGTYSASPIPTDFMGILDGLGNTLTHLSISARFANDNVGFFSHLVGGSISNIVLTSVKIRVRGAPQGKDVFVGPLVGLNAGGFVLNVFASGSISGSSGRNQEMYVAGLVGYNAGSMTNTVSAVSVAFSNSGVGGLVGVNDGTIFESHASGAVGGNGFTAGLCAFNSDTGIINMSSASGDVFFTGTRDRHATQNGGLVGENEGSVRQSYATGSVSGAWVGGLIGSNARGVVRDSYTTGAVSGDLDARAAGGLFGSTGGAGPNPFVKAVYSTGAVSSEKQSATLGGLVGTDVSDGQIIVDGYWDTETSGISNPSQGAGDPPNDPGITGLTTMQLQSGLPEGFSPKIWAQNIGVNNGFPYLIANPPLQ